MRLLESSRKFLELAGRCERARATGQPRLAGLYERAALAEYGRLHAQILCTRRPMISFFIPDNSVVKALIEEITADQEREVQHAVQGA